MMFCVIRCKKKHVHISASASAISWIKFENTSKRQWQWQGGTPLVFSRREMEMSSHRNRSIKLNFPQTPTHWEALYAFKKRNFTRCSWWKWCNGITHLSMTSCSYITLSDVRRWVMVYERDEVAGIISLRVNSFAFNFISFFWFHGTDKILSVLHSGCIVFLMCKPCA